MDGSKNLRNLGWVCKGVCFPTKKKARVPSYECIKHSIHEFCLDCASYFNLVCPHCGGQIHRE